MKLTSNISLLVTLLLGSISVAAARDQPPSNENGQFRSKRRAFLVPSKFHAGTPALKQNQDTSLLQTKQDKNTFAGLLTNNKLVFVTAFWFTIFQQHFWDSLMLARRYCSTIYFTAMYSFAICILWKLPFLQSFMNSYFVLSRSNLASKRYPTLLLSSLSHKQIWHLALNLWLMLHFGIDVTRHSTVPIWPIMMGAAIAGNVAHLMFDDGEGIGLAHMTCAIFAIYARMWPNKFLVPGANVQAFQMLILLLVSELYRVVIRYHDHSSPAGHAAHLGGLLFGIVYHEVWQQSLPVVPSKCE